MVENAMRLSVSGCVGEGLERHMERRRDPGPTSDGSFPLATPEKDPEP